jgi:hypothetical protein
MHAKRLYWRWATLTVLIALVIGLLPLSAMPAEAAPLAISVDATWDVTEQLTTVDGDNPGIWDEGPLPGPTDDDDMRYVQASLVVTTTASFWTAEVTCSVDPTVLEGYERDYDQAGFNDWHDDQNMIEPGAMWHQGGDWAWYWIEGFSEGVNGQMKAVFTKRGNAQAIGQNGETLVAPLATLRYRVGPNAGMTGLNCSFSFLDRDGREVVKKVKYRAPGTLNVITGYTVTGTVDYQVHPVATNPITVECYSEFLPGGFKNTTTDKYGKFSLADLRVREGWLNCYFSGNTATGLSNLYLTSDLGFDMREHGSYHMLPITLKGGNVQQEDCGGGECINDNDIALITGNWGGTTGDGDANSDGVTDRADLAIVASNFYIGETVNAYHLIYSLARQWDGDSRNSSIWRGDTYSAEVVQQVKPKARNIDLWATLSPDGSTIALIRKDTRRDNYELYTVDATNPKAAAKALLKKNKIGNLDAFAPSWSRDGNQIAFICSEGYGHVVEQQWGTERWEYSGYGLNAGDLCIVDADGSHFRRLTSYNSAKIWPPAWEGNWLIFGGTTNTGQCANTLCVFDLSNNNWWRLDNDIPGGYEQDASGSYQEVSDMPVMMNGWLFYRYTWDYVSDPNQWSESSVLRVVMDGFDYGSCDEFGNCDFVKPLENHPGARPGDPGNDASSPRPEFLHTTVMYNNAQDYWGDPPDYRPLDVDHNPGIPFRVDYLEVAPYSLNLLYQNTNWGGEFYESQFYGYTQDQTSGPCADGITTDTNQCFPEWSPNTFWNSHQWRVDGQAGNWYVNSGNPLRPWDQDSLLFAERETVDWVP